ncbi:MAG: hypothetical protein ABDH32_05015 [Candidatus Caldarchaeales archaeon]
MSELARRVYTLDLPIELLENTYERVIEFIENSKILEFEVDDSEELLEDL